MSAEVNPDFMVEPEGVRAVAEVKQFETTRITDRLTPGRVATLDSREVYGPLRSKMIEAAGQLLPFAGAGVPLIVVLANPLRADVNLDFHHVSHAILGNPKITIGVGPDAPRDDPGRYIAEDYGALIAVTPDGLVNYHPHMSAVVVVHERSREQDWIDAKMAEEPDVASFEHIGAAMAHYLGLRERLAAKGETAPEGSYRWVEVYDLSGNPTPPGFQGVPLPRTLFSGPRDRLYGFSGAGFGELD